MAQQSVLILDFGSQYTQLIARRIRQLHVYCEILPHSVPWERIVEFDPQALVLSGGPSSVYAEGAPSVDERVFSMDVPILGICYGVQLMAHVLGGKVVAAQGREYGRATVIRKEELPPHAQTLLKSFKPGEAFEVWMSHGDRIEALPEGFVGIGTTGSTPFAAVAHTSRPVFGLQFHPEVVHTPKGDEILDAFVHDVAGLSSRWTMDSFIESHVRDIRERVGEHERVICGLSGGVDSSVVAALLHKAIGDRVQCIFVDHGLLRKDDQQHVREVFEKSLDIPVKVVDASERFLSKLEGVVDPERKRKIIGHEFIEVFDAEAHKIEGARFLAQGTLYPDVIESVSPKGGPSATIKSHHNVGGLPERMNLELIEPLRELFKDEVRELGMELGLPKDMCMRQPFPGPGLAVRILGDVTRERIAVLQEADAIFLDELQKSGEMHNYWQSFAVLLPIQSVGVMGDERTYEQTIALRSVDSVDGMTADWSRIPYDVLARASNRIINEVRGVNRVVYDISSKPPATVEWE